MKLAVNTHKTTLVNNEPSHFISGRISQGKLLNYDTLYICFTISIL